MKQLQDERAAAQNGQRHDWEATVEKYQGDEDILAVLAEAMKLRERERKAARKTQPKARRATT